MIHLDSMHEAIDEISCNAIYEENVRYVDRLVANLELLKNSNNELKSYGIYTEDRDELYLESVVDVVRKIGEHVIDLVQKAIDLWKGLVNKVKTMIFNHKSTEKQLETIAKKDPEAAEKIKIAIDAGNFKMADIKDLNAFYKEMDNIIDAIDRASEDEKSLKNRIHKAAHKINSSEGIKAVMGLIGVVTATGACYVGIKKAIDARNGGEKALENLTQQGSIQLVKIQNKVNAYQKINAKNLNAPDNEKIVSKMHLMATVAEETNRVTTGQHQALYRFVTSITGKLNKVENTLLRKTTPKKYMASVEYDKHGNRKGAFNKAVNRQVNNMNQYYSTDADGNPKGKGADRMNAISHTLSEANRNNNKFSETGKRKPVPNTPTNPNPKPSK